MKAVTLDTTEVIPSKIVCIGRNYVEHIKELENELPDEPVVFLKPNSAISTELRLHPTDELHYEGELCFLIKSGAICAIGFGLDLTKRQVQAKLKAKGLPWEKSKAFDGSAVFSDFISYSGELAALRLELEINGQQAQSGSYLQMMFKPAAFMADIQSFLTLEDGDIIMSGTPKGVGRINAGDTFTGRIFAGEQLIVEKTWQVSG